MISIYFNERGYFIDSPIGQSKFTYDLPKEIEDNAVALYSFRWMVFSHAMEAITNLFGDALQGEELILYSDSRLIEELMGDIVPDNYYAKSSQQYFITHDMPRYRRVRFEKCSATSIDSKINELCSVATRSR